MTYFRFGSRPYYTQAMKMIILTDVHANYPALEAAMHSIEAEGYDRFVHLGDAISIGPFPAECLDRLLNTPNATLIMGNHDKWFAEGLPTPQPEWMSDGEVAHQQWTHAQLDRALRSTVAQWPYVVEETIQGTSIRFTHFALDESGEDFGPIIREPTSADLDQLFASAERDLIFYGHNHTQSDIRGRTRYINPGPLGCHDQPLARYSVAEFQDGSYRVEHKAVPYDVERVAAAYRDRHVPEREFLCKIFFGGQISP